MPFQGFAGNAAAFGQPGQRQTAGTQQLLQQVGICRRIPHRLPAGFQCALLAGAVVRNVGKAGPEPLQHRCQFLNLPAGGLAGFRLGKPVPLFRQGIRQGAAVLFVMGCKQRNLPLVAFFPPVIVD